jgi:dinuclear metal center YbgI/SA1388 family protein
MKRTKLVNQLTELLKPFSISDYCPNGLQVEGAEEVKKIVTGVTASQALIDAAIAAGADTILVHHGFFWKGEDQTITGMKQRRIKALLENNINLLAYHLPLDVHHELGNNA